MKLQKNKKISVVIPCYKVKNKILQIIKKIGKEIKKIYVIDDFCPQKTGLFLKKVNKDKRVKILFNKKNMGVGKATMKGLEYAFNIDKADICVKLDGDGQMDPKNIQRLCDPIIKNKSLYTKGNRFFFHKEFFQMPLIRVLGNFFLSFFGKITTGQYSIFDVTNGYIAISAAAYKKINWKKINYGFFFETDVLAALRIAKIQALDIPIKTQYYDEKSNLIIKKIFFEFLFNNFKIFFQRIKSEYIAKKNILALFVIANITLGFFLSIFNYEYFAITIIAIIFFIQIDSIKIVL